MMSTNKSLFAGLFFAASALAFGACNDDPPKNVNCRDTPEADECKDIDCDKTPDIEECKAPPVDCDKTPDHEECVVVACDDIDAVIKDALAPHDTVAEFVQPVVNQVDSGFRTLTFKAGGGRAPHGSPRLYLDIESNSFLEISDVDALTNTEWDIAFDAVGYAYTNSGQTGKGGLMVGSFDGITNQREFLAIQQPGREDITWETDTFVDELTCEVTTDRFIGEDFLTTSIGAWFAYDFTDHSTNPVDKAYAVYNRNDNHHVYKIKFLSYDSRTTEIQLGVAEFPCSPEDTETAVLEALKPSETAVTTAALDVDKYADRLDILYVLTEDSTDDGWVYLNLRSYDLVEISDVDALTSLDWDIALKGSEIRLNSANSGKRNLRLAKVDGVTTEEEFIDYPVPGPSESRNYTWLQDTFIDGYTCDELTFGQGSLQTAFGQWYDYDMDTHTLSVPQDIMYFIYDSVDNHTIYKFKIIDYSNGRYDLAVRR